MSQVFHLRESPISPQCYGSSHLFQAKHFEINMKNATSINLISRSDLPKENVYENTSICIEKGKEEKEPTLISPSKYGLGFIIMQKQGYDGHSCLRSQKQGIIEPITTKGRPRSLGLGFKPL